MQRMAEALEINIFTTTSKPKDKTLGRLYPDTLDSVAFPLIEGLLDLSKAIWQKPTPIPATACKLENMFKVPQENWCLLYLYSAPTLMITQET